MTREKNGKWPGISQKKGEFGNFHSILLFLNREIAKYVLVFFRGKNKTIFLTLDNLQNMSPKLYFLGGEGSNIHKKA